MVVVDDEGGTADDVVEVDPTGRRVCGAVVLVVDCGVSEVDVVEAGEVDVEPGLVDEVDDDVVDDDVDDDDVDDDEVEDVEVDVDVVEIEVDEVEDVDVVVGPAGRLLTAGENPRRADNSVVSLPSMPRAQIPMPPKLCDAASCAAS